MLMFPKISTFAKAEDYKAPRAKKDKTIYYLFLVCRNASGKYKITPVCYWKLLCL